MAGDSTGPHDKTRCYARALARSRRRPCIASYFEHAIMWCSILPCSNFSTPRRRVPSTTGPLFPTTTATLSSRRAAPPPPATGQLGAADRSPDPGGPASTCRGVPPVALPRALPCLPPRLRHSPYVLCGIPGVSHATIGRSSIPGPARPGGPKLALFRSGTFVPAGVLRTLSHGRMFGRGYSHLMRKISRIPSSLKERSPSVRHGEARRLVTGGPAHQPTHTTVQRGGERPCRMGKPVEYPRGQLVLPDDPVRQGPRPCHVNVGRALIRGVCRYEWRRLQSQP
jgi:hypothetical protein